MPIVSKEEIHHFIGKEVGVSDWLLITQERVNQFATVTGDHQFIHTDPERAKQTPFGGTIAHGYLTLSLLPHLGSKGGSLGLDNVAMGINYGLNKVRFLAPVKVGSQIRARYLFLDSQEKKSGNFLLTHQVTIEIQGEEKPAMIAEVLAMVVLK